MQIIPVRSFPLGLGRIPSAPGTAGPWRATTSARASTAMPVGADIIRPLIYRGPRGAGRFFGGGFAGFLLEAPPAPPTRPGPRFLSQRKRGKERAGVCPRPPPKKQGPMAAVGCTDRAKPTVHCRPLRRHKFQIIRFAASGKAHSFHCALAPVAALRFPGQTGPPIAPLLFPGSLYPPLAALRRETLPTEPASLGFGGGPVFIYVTGAAAPRAARIGITLQALKAAALYRLGPPGRRWCHAAEIPWCLWRLGNGAPGSSRPT